MTFGFCFALLPLLSLDPESVFGSGHTLIKRIPDEDLSCPEEYLEKIAPPPPLVKAVDDESGSGDVESGDAMEETMVSEMSRDDPSHSVSSSVFVTNSGLARAVLSFPQDVPTESTPLLVSQEV